MEDPDFIGDWYRERKLGSGGFGTVMLWRNRKTDQKVAIKKCNQMPANEISEKQNDRWIQEVQMMKEIDHENIVKGIDIKPESFLIELSKMQSISSPILVMEYCEGGDLRYLLSQNQNASGLLESDVRNVLKCIGNAIAYLHTLKITHRDIKPENIVIKRLENDEKVFKLTDLGYAKGLDMHSLKASLVGTIEYIAPELLLTEKYSCTVDYWSFGVIAFEIITGIRPFLPYSTLAQWFITVKKKKSDDICITEDMDGIHFSSELFKENHISSVLASYMEKWLRLALEWNSKQRGHVFENNKPLKSVTFVDDTNKVMSSASNEAPINVLKLFTMLDEILQKKILTIFCLQNRQNLSFEIDENSTMEWLINRIEEVTNIPKDKVRITVALDNELNSIDSTTKPIDLYLNDYYDKPMIYVSKIDTDVTLDNMKVVVPEIVKKFLENPATDYKPFIHKMITYNTYYFIRKEQQIHMEYLRGYSLYSLRLNHDIVIYEQEVTTMIRRVYGLEGALKLYESTLKFVQNDAECENAELKHPKWMDQLTKLKNNCGNLITASESLIKRYKSILRRSTVANTSPSFSNIEQDYYAMKDMEKIFEGIRSKLATKTKIDVKELIRRSYQCIKRRDELIRDEEFIKWRTMTPRIDIEFDVIRNAVKNATMEAEKLGDAIFAANATLQKATRCIQSKSIVQGNGLDLIPDIDTILNTEAQQPKSNNIDFDIGKIVTQDLATKYGRSILCFGEGDDAASLIEDNEKLRITMDGLINDIDAEISKSGDLQS